MKAKTIEAKVLWWDSRDERGVCIDEAGNEYYIDISVCRRREAPLRNQLVRGLFECLGGTPCLQDLRDFLEKE